MTAPYKVDMVTESVISHMAARIAALEAENAELKRVTFDPRVLDQMNVLESERDTLRQQLATARPAGAEVKPFGYLCDWGDDIYGLQRVAFYYGEPGNAFDDDWNEHPKVHKNLPLYTSAPTPAQQPRQESEIAAEALEEAAIAAWMHYADVCRKQCLNPHHHGQWIASDAIRSLAAQKREAVE